MGATAGALALTGPAPAAHAVSSCAPLATLHVEGGQATVTAYFGCGGTGAIRVVNRAGDQLGSGTSVSCPGFDCTRQTVATCSGAIVHGFAWVNVNGTVYSNTTGEQQC